MKKRFLTTCFFSLAFAVCAFGQYPNPQLIAFYPMNGDANDYSGHGLHGTAHGGIATMTDRFGFAGGAFYFDGVDDFIRVTRDALLEPSSEFTVCAWVKPEVTPTYHYNTIITKRIHHADDPFNSYILDAGGTATQNKYFFSASNDVTFGSQQQLTSTVDWTNSSGWDFVVGVYDGQEMKVYVNGVLNVSQAFTGDIGYNSYDLFIGTPSYPLQFLYKGGMDDVAIFGRALTATEIAAAYTWTGDIQSVADYTVMPVLYPNPASSEIRINLPGEEMPLEIQIIDSKGTVVLSGTYSDQVLIDHLPEGVYSLRLHYADGRLGKAQHFIRKSAQ